MMNLPIKLQAVTSLKTVTLTDSTSKLTYNPFTNNFT